MSELDAYFAETMPDDERLSNFRAFARGAFTNLNYLLTRLAAYHDLLELELEGNPASQIYLKESGTALARAGGVLNAIQELTQRPGDGRESFDLLLLLQGVATRLRKIGLAELKLDNKARQNEDFDH